MKKNDIDIFLNSFIQNVEDEENAVEIEKTQKRFIAQYKKQFNKINNLWEEFWDSKYSQFESLVRESHYPQAKNSLFFQERIDKRRKIELDAYEYKFIDLIENWLKEASRLPYQLTFKCPYCKSNTKVNLELYGPGSDFTYGGSNMNTYSRISELPDEILYAYAGAAHSHPGTNKILKEGYKYHWRSLQSMNADCPDCNKNIFKTDAFGSNFTPNNFGHCSIYIPDDTESFVEFVGVWRTFYSFLALDYELKIYNH